MFKPFNGITICFISNDMKVNTVLLNWNYTLEKCDFCDFSIKL